MAGELDELIPVEEIARTIGVIGHLDTIEGLVHTADRIHTNFPKQVRDGLVCGDCNEVGLDAHSSAKVSIALAQLSPKVRHELICMIEEVRRYISEDEENSEIDSDTLQLIGEMLTFSQSLGSRSRRNLLHALRSANENDHGFALIEMRGRDSEVATARRVCESTKKDFGL